MPATPNRGPTATSFIRVLFIAHDSELYGAQMSLLDILRNLDRTRFLPLVVAPAKGPFTDEVERYGIPIVTIGKTARWIFPQEPFKPRRYIRRPWMLVRTPRLCLRFFLGLPVRLGKLRKLIRSHGVDIVYTNTITVIDGALVARLCAIPHVWHLREEVHGNSEILSILPAHWIARIARALSTRVICNSVALKARLFTSSDEDDKVRVVYNGIDSALFAAITADAALRASLRVPPSAPVIGICGSIQERKGHEGFIRAAAYVSKTHPGVHFLVIGDGHASYVDRMKALGHALGIGAKLHFTGWRKDVPALFALLDILVIASEQEPFGRTVIEGMAAAKPIVATRSGGPEEIVVHGETGFLVPVGDPYTMAQRLCDLLNNPLLGRAFGEAGRRRVAERFTLEATLRGVENLIVETVTHSGSTQAATSDNTSRNTNR